jgi:hypothetical protein
MWKAEEEEDNDVPKFNADSITCRIRHRCPIVSSCASYVGDPGFRSLAGYLLL